MTALRAQHASKGNHFMGVNGETGEIIDVTSLGIWDTFAVKQQILRTAIEAVR
jgi:T-complex protein 1 subunit gamma